MSSLERRTGRGWPARCWSAGLPLNGPRGLKSDGLGDGNGQIDRLKYKLQQAELQIMMLASNTRNRSQRVVVDVEARPMTRDST